LLYNYCRFLCCLYAITVATVDVHYAYKTYLLLQTTKFIKVHVL